MGKWNLIKNIVQKNNNTLDKERDGFNLDLTYITDNVIGMSYPASKTSEKLWRNSIDKV
jgi:hypothetical protein